MGSINVDDGEGETMVEGRSGISFPLELDDGKHLNCVGLRNKSVLGLCIKIYAFGMYADNEKLRCVVQSKLSGTPTKPSKEMYEVVVDSDVAMVVRLVILFPGLTMAMVRNNLDQGLGASIQNLAGAGAGDNINIDDLASKVLGEVKGSIRLTSGSVIEISRLPGYVLRTRVKGEVVSEVESELLCRAFINLYLGDDAIALDKHAKHQFGMSLLSMF